MKILTYFAALFVLSGCAPLIQKDYHTPEDQMGRMCINDCLRDRSHSLDQCSSDESRCLQSVVNMKAVESLATADSGVSQSVFHLQHSCKDIYNKCEQRAGSTYDQCFQNCGGMISRREVPYW